MSAEPFPKKKKKKKKKKQRLQSPANTLSPTNHYDGSFGAPDGAPTFVGDDITNPMSTPRLIQHILATKVQLFKLDIAKREKIDLGKKVVAIVPDQSSSKDGGAAIYNIIVYDSKNRRLILSVCINNTFNLGILGATSLSFNDSKNELYSFSFPDPDMLYEFICACCMAKIFRNDLNTNNHRMIIQDLNNANSQPLSVNSDTSVCDTQLKLWMANHKQHPYKRGKLLYSGQKTIYLKSGKWIMSAITDALKGMRPTLKRLLIVPPQFGFGQNGNDKLGVRRNSTLIIEIELNSVQQSKLPQYASDAAMLNICDNSYTVSGGHGSGSNSIALHNLKKENDTLKQEILRLNHRINDLVKDNRNLKKTLDFHEIAAVKEKTSLRKAIKTETKKLQQDLGQFGARFEAYDLEIDYTKKHYLEWNCEDVIDWVLSLNYGSFAKYASLLRQNVPRQHIKGKHLAKLDKYEWKSLGLLDPDDCLSIIDHVKALTMEEKQKFANNFDNFANNFDPNINLFD